jgi:hypothetical protein
VPDQLVGRIERTLDEATQLSTVHKQIEEYLKPLLGETTAANLLRHYCSRMQMSVDAIELSHLPGLAEAMKPMLAVWLGSAGASRVAEELGQLGRGASAK